MNGAETGGNWATSSWDYFKNNPDVGLRIAQAMMPSSMQPMMGAMGGAAEIMKYGGRQQEYEKLLAAQQGGGMAPKGTSSNVIDSRDSSSMAKAPLTPAQQAKVKAGPPRTPGETALATAKDTRTAMDANQRERAGEWDKLRRLRPSLSTGGLSMVGAGNARSVIPPRQQPQQQSLSEMAKLLMERPKAPFSMMGGG